uniref:Anti-neuroexcitation peptide 2 n=1 Tax=Olivierus martensii TaxID=34649 RepID=SCN2_OLIMR|nr:RecName: Full=Anti-neuroexcitation peptide 2; Short=BmKANEP2; AltName: Full=Anti-neuroexcitation peptide II; Short=ANEPII; Flags: Precursor [Mesobuthus martensii]AAK28341.1 anti-neuroexcitation peptide II precursor [Mesobuthus martensii]
MKLSLLLVISASMLIDGLVNADGYIRGSNGCKVSCLWGNDGCNKECRAYGASYGYCWTWGLACWCEGLPDDKTWKSESNTCGGKK